MDGSVVDDKTRILLLSLFWLTYFTFSRVFSRFLLFCPLQVMIKDDRWQCTLHKSECDPLKMPPPHHNPLLLLLIVIFTIINPFHLFLHLLEVCTLLIISPSLSFPLSDYGSLIDLSSLIYLSSFKRCHLSFFLLLQVYVFLPRCSLTLTPPFSSPFYSISTSQDPYHAISVHFLRGKLNRSVHFVSF